MIHIHGDINDLLYFSDKNGVCAYSSRYVAYAMEGSHIVGVFYTIKEAESFYERNKNNDSLPIIYFWDEERWLKQNNNHDNT